jgi:hypothetical protein
MARVHDLRFELLGASFAVLYFVAPDRYEATLFIYPRFSSLALLFLALGACARGEKGAAAPWWAKSLCVLPAAASLAIVSPRFVASDHLYRGLDEAIEHLEPESRYMVLHIGTRHLDQFECEGIVGHIVAALGGRGFYDYTESEVSPIVERAETQWQSVFTRVGWGSGNWIPAHDMKRYRYMVLHADETDLLDVGIRALQPEGRLLYREGEWAVVESTLPLDPIDAPDDPAAMPPPLTLEERLLILSGGKVTRQLGPAR